MEIIKTKTLVLRNYIVSCLDKTMKSRDLEGSRTYKMNVECDIVKIFKEYQEFSTFYVPLQAEGQIFE
jgi:hypothetical protein